MTDSYKWTDDTDEPSVNAAREALEAEARRTLDERMTVMELRLGNSLWQHSRVKIPKGSLQRIALDLSEHALRNNRQILSSVTYGQFYSRVGIPEVPEADRDKPFSTSPEREAHEGYSGLR